MSCPLAVMVIIVALFRFDVAQSIRIPNPWIHRHAPPPPPVTHLVGGVDWCTRWDNCTNLQEWARINNFHTGDKLLFWYDRENHDVNRVDPDGYNGCDNSKRHLKQNWNSGSSLVELQSGMNYFICSYHCKQFNAMKLALWAYDYSQ